MPRHVKTGDTVVVNTGDDRGRTGQVIKVIPKRDLVIVQGVNTKTKHLKPSQTSPQGGIVTKEMPIHISNVSPVVEDNKPTRVRFTVKKDGAKVRLAARNGEELSVLRKPKKKTKKKTVKK